MTKPRTIPLASRKRTNNYIHMSHVLGIFLAITMTLSACGGTNTVTSSTETEDTRQASTQKDIPSQITKDRTQSTVQTSQSKVKTEQNTNSTQTLSPTAQASSPTNSPAPTTVLTVTCNVNNVDKTIECTAEGYGKESGEESELFWWTNVEGGPDGRGPDFTLSFARFNHDLDVTLEACDQAGCITITTPVDLPQSKGPESAPPSQQDQSTSNKTVTSSQQEGKQTDQPASTSGMSAYGTDLTGCSPAVKPFEAAPVPLDTILRIWPMGKVGGRSGHITPTDHLYIDVKSSGTANIPVRAITDGYVVKITRSPDRETRPDWRVILEHSCSIFSWYIHLDKLSDTILKSVANPIAENGTWFGKVPVKSGEPVGYVGELLSYQERFKTDQFDWAVTDSTTTLKGFIIPQHYDAEPWKVHIVDPYQHYLDNGLKNALIDKTEGNNVPLSGKIDYDIDGRLVGNWFLEGTKDYSGSGLTEVPESEWGTIIGRDMGECTRPIWDRKSQSSPGNVPCAYFVGHAAFAYNYIQTGEIRISFGVYYDGEGGLQTPWAVLGNGPDPADVGVESGEVRYELVDGAYEGSGSERTQGTLLVKMIDARSIRTEFFAGLRADAVKGFSEKARIYRR